MRSAIDGIIAFGLLISGIAYALGQFFGSRKKGLSESLNTALSEIEAQKQKSERLEEELTRQRKELEYLKSENESLKKLLREVGPADYQKIIDAITSAFEILKESILEEIKKVRE